MCHGLAGVGGLGGLRVGLGDRAGRTEGFTKPAPTVVFLVALVLSMAGLAYAMRELPTGTAYAVWTGIGAALTVAFGMVTAPSRPPFCGCSSWP